MISIENSSFIFNGVKSSDMGLYIVRVDQSGTVETPFFGGQDLNEEVNKISGESYLYGTAMQPIEFTVTVSLLEEEWTPQKRREVAKWLIGKEYRSFQTTDDMGKCYYAVCTEFPVISVSNGMGYGDITFRTNAPYAWTSTFVDYFDLSSNLDTSMIEVNNKSNILKYYEPKIEVELVEGGDFTLRNLSDGGREFSLVNLSTGETVSVDNKNKFIESSLPLSYRFENFNRNWLRLVQGVNRIEVSGSVKIKIKAQYPIIQ